MRTQGEKNMDIGKNKRKLEVGLILKIVGVQSGAFIKKAASGLASLAAQTKRQELVRSVTEYL